MNEHTEAVLAQAIGSREARRQSHVTYLDSLVEQQREVVGWIAELDREIAGLRADLPQAEVADPEFPGSYIITVGLAHLVHPSKTSRPLCNVPWSYERPAERRDIPRGATWLCGTCRKLAPKKGYRRD